ncbi:hypothetical protein [Ferrimicrobium sp.]|uniref:hypothetical protein n=1 Tax=Ferrimicrobium sp. TaxID=2926050 RepID=UPI0026305123|nr:hypothetical protein [Ferrimicrobium sp.]
MRTRPIERQCGQVVRDSPPQLPIWLGAVVGGSALLLSGLIHLHLWLTGYRHVPVIGLLFVLQAALALVLAIAVLLRRQRWVFIVASIFLLGTIGGLLASVEVGLFGFRDAFNAPLAMESLLVETVGALVLAFLGLLVGPG